MTREERLNAIFDSDKPEMEKIIAYQHIVIEELSEQNLRLNTLFIASMNKKLQEVH